MLALWSGLAAGGLHAVSGPDHVAALAPLAAGAPARAVRLGATWGAGHGAGLILLVAAAGLLRQFLPAVTLGWAAELCVGLWLVWLGLDGMRNAAHPHVHGLRAAFGVGVLHGATGVAHMLAVLPGIGLDGADAYMYLVAYALSAAACMSVVGALVGGVVQRSHATLVPRLRRGFGALALVVGVAWTLRAIIA